jgi:hypothetical protein
MGRAARSEGLGPWLLGSVLLLLCMRKKIAGRKEKRREKRNEEGKGKKEKWKKNLNLEISEKKIKDNL